MGLHAKLFFQQDIFDFNLVKMVGALPGNVSLMWAKADWTWCRDDASDKPGKTYQVHGDPTGVVKLIECRYIPSPNPFNGTIPLSHWKRH